MSDRIHIGFTEEEWYDCVVADSWGAYDKLMAAGMAGPFKIRISNVRLWQQVEPQVQEYFEDIGREYPEGISRFYINRFFVSCPTPQELATFVEENPQ